MGKGEGAQAYGWGLYFAESPEVNRSYLNQFAQDKATRRFRDLDTSDIDVMQRALTDSLLLKDALPEAKKDAEDLALYYLGELSDARGDNGKIEAISGAMGALSGVYGLAELSEAVYSKLTGEKYRVYGNTVSDHVVTLWRGMAGVVRMYNGEEEEYGDVMNQLGRGLNGMGVFAAAGRPEIGAAVQVMGRIVKETKSMAGTWGHLWDDEMAKAKEQQRLIRATRADEKKEKEEKQEESSMKMLLKIPMRLHRMNRL